MNDPFTLNRLVLPMTIAHATQDLMCFDMTQGVFALLVKNIRVADEAGASQADHAICDMLHQYVTHHPCTETLRFDTNGTHLATKNKVYTEFVGSLLMMALTTYRQQYQSSFRYLSLRYSYKDKRVVHKVECTISDTTNHLYNHVFQGKRIAMIPVSVVQFKKRSG